MLASKFVEGFRRDPREGYARSFYAFLQGVKNGSDFLSRIEPFSDKSGAAMRAPPIGIFSDINEVIEKCSIQAKLTHNTSDGVNAAVAAALMAHYFLYELGPKSNLAKFIETHVDGDWSGCWRGKVGGKGWMSVRAAITAVMQSNSLSELLKQCIAFTGDVDTVAAIAMGAAAHSQEIVRDLPPVLLNGLEDGPFGKSYLQKLDAELLHNFHDDD